VRCPDRQSSARESAVGEYVVELNDSRGDFFCGPCTAGNSSDRCGVWKSLLDQCAKRGHGSRHEGGRSYTEEKPKARMIPTISSLRAGAGKKCDICVD
jgi:hypothetical protein